MSRVAVPMPAPRPSPQDLALALVVAAVSIAGTLAVASGSAAVRAADPAAVVLLGLCALPLAVRRRQPVACLSATTGVALAYDLIGLPGAFSLIAVGISLFSAVEARRRVAGILAAGATIVGFSATGLLIGRGHVTDLGAAGWLTGWLAVAVIAGEVQRGRRDYVEAVERRALEAERTREEEARRRATEERLRIARDLHDVLGHHLSTISVQAGVALHLLDRQPGSARTALEAINTASKEALGDLRATLGLLRQVDEPQPRQPATGLGSLDELLATTRAAGVEVALEIRGEPRELPSTVDLAAFRIIQEALTNVIRHAGARVARLVIEFSPDAVEIGIENEGGPEAGTKRDAEPSGASAAAATPPATGHGLIGMRERATALGGAFRGGPRASGGFEVHVRLPLRGPT